MTRVLYVDNDPYETVIAARYVKGKDFVFETDVAEALTENGSELEYIGRIGRTHVVKNLGTEAPLELYDEEYRLHTTPLADWRASNRTGAGTIPSLIAADTRRIVRAEEKLQGYSQAEIEKMFNAENYGLHITDGIRNYQLLADGTLAPWPFAVNPISMQEFREMKKKFFKRFE